MVLNDCNNAVWQGGTLNFILNVAALDKNSVIIMYDMTAANGGDPMAYIRAASSKYWQMWNVTPTAGTLIEYLKNQQIGGEVWQLNGFQPQGANSVQYGWRVYATNDQGQLVKEDGSPAVGLNDAFFKDYSNNQSTISIYDPLAVPSFNISPSSNIKPGDNITMELTTGSIVDRVDVIDANGAALNATSSYTDSGNTRKWTIQFSIASDSTLSLAPRISATVGGVTKSAVGQYKSITVGSGGTGGGTGGGGGGGTGGGTVSTSGEVRLSNVPSANVVPGMSVTFNLDVEYAMADGTRYAYNATGSKFFDIIDYIEITPNATDVSYPFDADGAKRIMLRSLDEAQKVPFRYTMRARSNLQNGTYPLNSPCATSSRTRRSPSPTRPYRACCSYSAQTL